MTLIRQGKRVILPFDNFTGFPPTGNSNNFYFDSASVCTEATSCD